MRRGGVEFRYGETIEAIETSADAFTGVRTDAGRIEADVCVVALGSDTPARLRPHGIHVPVYPVKGYSMTFPAGGWNDAPLVPIADDRAQGGGSCASASGFASPAPPSSPATTGP